MKSVLLLRSAGEGGADSPREGPGPGRIINYRTDPFIGWGIGGSMDGGRGDDGGAKSGRGRGLAEAAEQ